ncbi:uncharacterized protein PFL1_01010 [Pseudozyma flocculosa PF-1]|uniref:uncharacterized protein n=1 Tax=Pseudozyma flocculosa PF-1 TaxID=1277687 RepID=UPI0004560393|nr:uncharacterized protein PFL1_01010 [Pseudozyma flocculosa PF-1]EPQ31677.1 hypothetical protein PFL1_01010 [Pseudozyma flocculosa PF-1]
MTGRRKNLRDWLVPVQAQPSNKRHKPEIITIDDDSEDGSRPRRQADAASSSTQASTSARDNGQGDKCETQPSGEASGSGAVSTRIECQGKEQQLLVVDSDDHSRDVDGKANDMAPDQTANNGEPNTTREATSSDAQRRRRSQQMRNDEYAYLARLAYIDKRPATTFPIVVRQNGLLFSTLDMTTNFLKRKSATLPKGWSYAIATDYLRIQALRELVRIKLIGLDRDAFEQHCSSQLYQCNRDHLRAIGAWRQKATSAVPNTPEGRAADIFAAVAAADSAALVKRLRLEGGPSDGAFVAALKGSTVWPPQLSRGLVVAAASTSLIAAEGSKERSRCRPMETQMYVRLVKDAVGGEADPRNWQPVRAPDGLLFCCPDGGWHDFAKRKGTYPEPWSFENSKIYWQLQALRQILIFATHPPTDAAVSAFARITSEPTFRVFRDELIAVGALKRGKGGSKGEVPPSPKERGEAIIGLARLAKPQVVEARLLKLGGPKESAFISQVKGDKHPYIACLPEPPSPQGQSTIPGSWELGTPSGDRARAQIGQLRPAIVSSSDAKELLLYSWTRFQMIHYIRAAFAASNEKIRSPMDHILVSECATILVEVIKMQKEPWLLRLDDVRPTGALKGYDRQVEVIVKNLRDPRLKGLCKCGRALQEGICPDQELHRATWRAQTQARRGKSVNLVRNRIVTTTRRILAKPSLGPRQIMGGDEDRDEADDDLDEDDSDLGDDNSDDEDDSDLGDDNSDDEGDESDLRDNNLALREAKKRELWAALGTWVYKAIVEGKGLCKYCGAVLCLYGPTPLASTSWCYVSIDRVVPGVDGGRYEAHNIAVVCRACQMTKFSHPVGTFQGVLLPALSALPTLRLDSSNIVVQPAVDVAPMTAAERLQAKEWLKVRRKQNKAWQAIHPTRKRKPWLLTEDEGLALIASRWIGHGKIVDCYGLEQPLEWSSIDRIDSDKPYQNDNVRMMLAGLNLLKREHDDTQGMAYLAHLRGAFAPGPPVPSPSP